jgi:hypothetical protein
MRTPSFRELQHLVETWLHVEPPAGTKVVSLVRDQACAPCNRPDVNVTAIDVPAILALAAQGRSLTIGKLSCRHMALDHSA